MKKITFLLALGLFFIANQATSQIRIVKADTSNGEVTIKNFGGATDITSYRLCARFSYTTQNNLASFVTQGDLNLSTNEEVTITWATLMGFTLNSDLGLYTNTTDFNSQAAMVDFTQWGSGGNGRESVADGKGIWTAGQFITVDGSPFVYTGNGSQNGNSFWTTENVLSIKDNVLLRNLKVHPNPTKNQFYITTNAVVKSVKITSLSGQLVKEIIQNLNKIDVSDLANGLYFIEVTSNNQKGVKRLVIQ